MFTTMTNNSTTTLKPLNRVLPMVPCNHKTIYDSARKQFVCSKCGKVIPRHMVTDFEANEVDHPDMEMND